jgi:serine/threonine-protein kinase HipA
MARTLDVYLHQSQVGQLAQNDHGEMSFSYGESWLVNAQAVPLSHSLPLRREPFPRKECRGFFAGVLPEASQREIVARNLGVSARNDFSLLEQIGGECAGAVTFLPPGSSISEEKAKYRLLPDARLAEILRSLPRRPLLAGEDGIRLSLAGAQDKLAVRIYEGGIYIPLDGAPSTHILKPAIDRLEGLVHNELLCMRLAEAAGLNTGRLEMGKVEDIEFLLIERFDRTASARGLPQRLHQEDFCQALGIVPEEKYQSEGGPSFADCFRLLRDASSAPVVDLPALLDAAIFNFLIGNNDAHGKNYSLLYAGNDRSSRKTTLAPLYDLLSTVHYLDLSRKMAMKLGGEYDADKVAARHFDRLAEETGLAKPVVRRRIRRLTERVLAQVPGVTEENKTSLQVAGIIKSRCERTLKMMDE